MGINDFGEDLEAISVKISQNSEVQDVELEQDNKQKTQRSKQNDIFIENIISQLMPSRNASVNDINSDLDKTIFQKEGFSDLMLSDTKENKSNAFSNLANI